MIEKISKQVQIDSEGIVRFVWDDMFSTVTDEGRCEIKRASHVEPVDGGLWEADMAPSGGPKLGVFRTRAAAIKAELSWLRENKGL